METCLPVHSNNRKGQAPYTCAAGVQAGGRGSSGTLRILTIQPDSLHERIPVFLGSPNDIAELESFGDVQQLGNKKYTA